MARSSFVFFIWLWNFISSEQTAVATCISNVHQSRPLPSSDGIRDISKHCQELGYCEEVEVYPEELAKQISIEMNKARILLYSDKDIELKTEVTRSPGDQYNACDSKPMKITPRFILDVMDGMWHYAVNPRDNPIQQYIVETCDDKRNQTMCTKQIIPQNPYTTRCVQKYVTRTVVVINNRLEQDVKTFCIPCCCSCVVVKDAE